METTANVQHGSVLRYLALGDSYTIGEAVTPSARWPNQLVEALRPAFKKETASRPPTSWQPQVGRRPI